MVRLLPVCEVGSESLRALRIGMQAGATRDRSFFCKCVSRLDARQVPWHRQGPEEVVLESQVLAAVESAESHVFIVLMIVSWFL